MAEAKTDMISELPEELLVTILCLVPTKEAVATMFLSKRWLSVWKKVPILEYKDKDSEEDTDDDDDKDENKKSVWFFLNRSLQLHNAAVIVSLCMELGPGCPTDIDIGKLVKKAVDSLLKRLIFKLRWSADPIRLPKSLYSCQSLVVLILSHQILVDVPSSACLPSLRELELESVVYKNEDSLVRLLSSCPVLENLFVTRERDDNVKTFTVEVPYLWNFSYTNDWDEDDDSCLVLNAPAAKSFSICDISGDSCSIEDMPFLEHAYIDIESYADDKLLNSISSVLSLHLYLSEAMVMRCSTITVSRLIKLSIRPCRADWMTSLLLLLGNTPKLKEFLVDYVYDHEYHPYTWNQPSPVPGCLSSQLETFEWRKYGHNLEEIQFLTYILANSMSLKTVTISLRPTIDQESIIEDLKDIPRVSTQSHLFINYPNV